MSPGKGLLGANCWVASQKKGHHQTRKGVACREEKKKKRIASKTFCGDVRFKKSQRSLSLGPSRMTEQVAKKREHCQKGKNGKGAWGERSGGPYFNRETVQKMGKWQLRVRGSKKNQPGKTFVIHRGGQSSVFRKSNKPKKVGNLKGVHRRKTEAEVLGKETGSLKETGKK